MLNSVFEKDVLIHVFAAAGVSVIPDETVLSVTDRGLVQIAKDNESGSRCIVRITPTNTDCSRPFAMNLPFMSTEEFAGPQRTAARMYHFACYTEAHGNEIFGLAPSISPVTVLASGYLVQKMKELTVGSPNKRRVDLHSYLIEGPAPSTKLYGYLHDVCHAVRDMHRHDFVHMDLALENVCLTDDHAYLIDFESVLPVTGRYGFMKSKYLQMPFREATSPPEHFLASPQDVISLKGYDVWAIGTILFSAVFKRTLIGHRSVGGKIEVNTEQVLFLFENGFTSFLEKYHSQCHSMLFRDRKSQWWNLFGDLLGRIFVSAKLVKQSSTFRIWTIQGRLTAEEVFHHAFWDVALKK